MTLEPPSSAELGELIFDNQGEYRGYLRSNQLKTGGCLDHTGQRLSLARYQRYRLGQQFLDSVLAEIPELKGHVRDWGYQRIYNQEQDPRGSMMLTHTDGERRGQHCIQALWATGGQGVKTTWWQESGYPVIRAMPHITNTAHTDLELLAEAEFAVCEWAIFRTDVLHSVQPIATERNSFSVGFTNPELFDLIVERYGC